ncbi:hypothetical protein ACWEVP_31700 [Amycolatopsis sp. NPDC003865]
MQTLEAPNGDQYTTSSDAEANSLILGHGYRLVRNDTDEPEQVTTPNEDPATEQPADSPTPDTEPATPSGPTPEAAPANPDQPSDAPQTNENPTA